MGLGCTLAVCASRRRKRHERSARQCADRAASALTPFDRQSAQRRTLLTNSNASPHVGLQDLDLKQPYGPDVLTCLGGMPLNLSAGVIVRRRAADGVRPQVLSYSVPGAAVPRCAAPATAAPAGASPWTAASCACAHGARPRPRASLNVAHSARAPSSGALGHSAERAGWGDGNAAASARVRGTQSSTSTRRSEGGSEDSPERLPQPPGPPRTRPPPRVQPPAPGQRSSPGAARTAPAAGASPTLHRRTSASEAEAREPASASQAPGGALLRVAVPDLLGRAARVPAFEPPSSRQLEDFDALW